MCIANQFVGLPSYPTYNSCLRIDSYYYIGGGDTEQIRIELTNTGSTDIVDGQVRYIIYR